MEAKRGIKEEPNYFLFEEEYNGSQPYFYKNEEYPWVKILEDNWKTIRDEFDVYISGKEEAPDTNLNPPYSKPGIWKNIYFSNFKWKKHRNCKKFPETYKILQSIPNIIFAGICQMEPRAEILPHVGESNVTTRGHLALKIPASLPECGFKVGDQERSWEEGKVFLFSDAHIHTAWNHTDERRFILLFDVIRPEFAPKQNIICSKILSTLTIKFLRVKFTWLEDAPKAIVKAMHSFLSAIWYLYLPLQRRLGIL